MFQCTTLLLRQLSNTKRDKTLLPALLALTAAIVSPTSMAADAVELINDDWQVACDNTRTCRIAGYHAENNSDFPVSVLLTRRAGNNTEVTGQIKIGGDKNSSAKALMQLGDRHRAALFIDGKDLGETKTSTVGAGYADLTASQVTALLESLTKSSKIELVVRNSRWQLSDKGAMAVMLKADEAQGRVGTTSALINKGSAKADSSVLAAQATPNLVLVKPNTTASNSSNKNFNVKASELATLVKGTIKDINNDCPNLNNSTAWRVSRLNDTQLLAQHQCWSGAYNTGDGMWVISDAKPYNPKLVTTKASNYDNNGTISSVQKGRGIGDCLAKAEWIWTGKSFTKSYEGTTGLCRLVADGGAWSLPTYVANVKR